MQNNNIKEGWRGKIQTLHNHTIGSDGKLGHVQTLDACYENDIGVAAFTDHDGLPNEKVVAELKRLDHPTKWVMGVELSCAAPDEFMSADKSSVHVVGLFVDPFNEKLVEHCHLMEDARRDRMRRIVKNLQEIGFDISEEDCLRQVTGNMVGLPHINSALWLKEHNISLLRGLASKIGEDAESDPVLRQKYDEMMIRGEKVYVYYLLFQPDAYIEGIYVDHGYLVNLDEAISLIRGAGGLSFAAHWTLDKERLSQEAIEKLAGQKRLDGIEVVFGSSIEGKDSQEVIGDMATANMIANKYGLLKGGGIDAHQKEDFVDFANHRLKSSLTIGMVEKIIEIAQPSLEWTSFSRK